MKNKTLLLSLLFVLTVWGYEAAVWSADYYVDSETGNDLSDGQSEAAAWRTISRVNEAKFRPGDRILFRRGGLWRGNLKLQSGDESNPLLYSAYGEGEKPRLYGSVALNQKSDWVKESDSIWVTRPDVIQTIDNGCGDEFLSGGWSFYTEGSAKASATIEGAGSKTRIEILCKNAGTEPQHIQLINSSFAIQKGKTFRVRFTASASKSVEPEFRLMQACPPWTSYGVPCGRQIKIGPEPKEFSLILRTAAAAEDARLTVYLGGKIPDETTLVMESFLIDAVDVDAVPFINDIGNVILDGKRAGVKKWRREDMQNLDDFWYDILGDGRLRFYSEENPAKKYRSIEAANREHIIDISHAGDVIVENLDLRYGAAHGFGGSRACRLTIHCCDISWIGGGDQEMSGGPGRRVRFGNGIEFWADASDCLVENCRLWEIYDAALTNQGNGTNIERNITYRNNEIWNSEYSFEYWNRNETSITENILFEGNRCYNAGFGWGHAQRPDPNGRHLMFYVNSAQTSGIVIRQNLFCGAADSLIRLEPSQTNPDWQKTGLSFESNQYFTDGNNAALWLGETIEAAGYLRFLSILGETSDSCWQKPENIPPVPENEISE